MVEKNRKGWELGSNTITLNKKGFLIQGPNEDNSDSLIQIAVTEKRTKVEIDLLVSTMKDLD